MLGAIIRKDDHKYERITEGDLELSSVPLDGPSCPSTSHSERRRRVVGYAWNAFVLVLALFGLFSLCRSMLPLFAEDVSSMSCDCGNSTAEALAMGCKYDSLAAAWLPEVCRDDDLTAEFERSGPGPDKNWVYYADMDGNRTLTMHEVAYMADDPEATWWTTMDWHIIHCNFYWRKEYRLAKGRRGKMEGRSQGEGHIKHCGQSALARGSLSLIATRAGSALNADQGGHKD